MDDRGPGRTSANETGTETVAALPLGPLEGCRRTGSRRAVDLETSHGPGIRASTSYLLLFLDWNCVAGLQRGRIRPQPHEVRPVSLYMLS